MNRASSKQLDGVLVLHKPGGPTSTDCLNVIKRTLGQKKIGHAGTLDPMATGVLVVLLGQGTKLANHLSAEHKTYCGTLLLGQTTDTYDVQGKTLDQAPWEHLDPGSVRAEILAWQGVMDQEVPPVSAAKHQGKPLYALHRAGQDTPVKSKRVTIFSVEVLELCLPRVIFRVSCSAGTYIRSLAHSLGKRLGCGAVLSELERESSHPFHLDQAHDLETVLASQDNLQTLVLPLAQALPHWPKLILTQDQTGQVRNGIRLGVELFPQYPALTGDKALFLDPTREPLALAEAREDEKNRLSWAILRGLWSS